MRFFRRFATLGDDEARRVLDALGASRLAALRRLHLSVRMMTQLAWYAVFPAATCEAVKTPCAGGC